MKFKAKEWEFIYTDGAEEGAFELMIYNPEEKELFWEEDVGKECLSGTDSEGEAYSAVYLKRATFDVIYRKLFRENGCASGFFDTWDAEDGENAPRKKGTRISADTVRAALCGECSEAELGALLRRFYDQNDRFEKGDYFDLPALLSMIRRYLRGDVSKKYYRDWTLVACFALGAHPYREGSGRGRLYERAADTFDGHAWDVEKEDCLKVIALLKYYGHLLHHVRKGTPPPFYSEEGVAVYVCFDHCNHYNEFCRVCVADTKNERFRMAYVANPSYLEEVNYTFADEDEFEELTSEYYGFFHDPSLDIGKYIASFPLRDQKGKTLA